jgi:hypothetical protein
MRSINRPTVWATALLLAAAFGNGTSERALAQAPPSVPVDCGPFHGLVGDLVAINVGNAGPATQGPLVIQVRLFDQDGSPILDRSLTLAPGHSRSVAARLTQGGLVRGEVEAVAPPDNLRLGATMQVPSRGRGGLTRGPTVVCAGPTGNRGPV